MQKLPYDVYGKKESSRINGQGVEGGCVRVPS